MKFTRLCTSARIMHNFDARIAERQGRRKGVIVTGQLSVFPEVRNRGRWLVLILRNRTWDIAIRIGCSLE
jgi:hypothetical protein